MPSIEELNKSIETITKECQAHVECYGCLMFENCHYRTIRNWELIGGGEQDE